MKVEPLRHEDDRRVLTEYSWGMVFKRAKVLEIKVKSTLGQHYHNKSDSIFYLLQGKGNYMLRDATDSNATIKREWLFPGDCIFVPRGMIHTFTLYPDTILLELATEIYDKEDEISATI